jgi:predicted porin
VVCWVPATFATPNFSGFSAALGYAFGTPAVAAANNGTANPTAEVNAKTDLGLNYNAGPLNAGLSYYRQADVNNQTNLYANYTFGPATVYAGYHKENKLAPGVATAESRGANIAVKYAITPSFNLSANFARLDDQSAANADKKIAAIGAQYLLSKRTSAYARYVQETNDNVPAVATSITGVKTALVGIQHNF